MVASLRLHCRVNISKDDEGLTSHPNVTLSNYLPKSVFTSIISPYYSNMVKRVSFNYSMGTFSLRLFI